MKWVHHISHAKTVRHVAREKWKDKKKETELSQIKGVQKKKQIIKATFGHDSVNPRVLSHASTATPSHNSKAISTANPRMQSSQKGLDLDEETWGTLNLCDSDETGWQTWVTVFGSTLYKTSLFIWQCVFHRLAWGPLPSQWITLCRWAVGRKTRDTEREIVTLSRKGVSGCCGINWMSDNIIF